MDQGQDEELFRLRVENLMLQKKLQRKKDYLENLKKMREKQFEKLQEARELSLSAKREADQREQEAELQWRLVALKKEEQEQLKKEVSELRQRKEETVQQEQKLSIYHDLLEKVAQETEFKDAQELILYLEDFFLQREEMFRKNKTMLEQTDELQGDVVSLEVEQQEATRQRSMVLLQLQEELQKSSSQADIRQKQWAHVQEEAAEKKLLLMQLKAAVLSMFESTGGTVSGAAEGAVGGAAGGAVGGAKVDINDTYTQLEKIESFLQDYGRFEKQLQECPKEKDETK